MPEVKTIKFPLRQIRSLGAPSNVLQTTQRGVQDPNEFRIGKTHNAAIFRGFHRLDYGHEVYATRDVGTRDRPCERLTRTPIRIRKHSHLIDQPACANKARFEYSIVAINEGGIIANSMLSGAAGGAGSSAAADQPVDARDRRDLALRRTFSRQGLSSVIRPLVDFVRGRFRFRLTPPA
jgi:hypothetical protein